MHDIDFHVPFVFSLVASVILDIRANTGLIMCAFKKENKFVCVK